MSNWTKGVLLLAGILTALLAVGVSLVDADIGRMERFLGGVIAIVLLVIPLSAIPFALRQTIKVYFLEAFALSVYFLLFFFLFTAAVGWLGLVVFIVDWLTFGLLSPITEPLLEGLLWLFGLWSRFVFWFRRLGDY